MSNVKKFLFVSIYFLLTLDSFSQESFVSNSPTESKIYELADIDEGPNYIGGVNAFLDFIGKNFDLPGANVTSGKIQIELVVEKDGSLSNLKSIADFGFGSGEEMIRVLKISPKWLPAKKNNSNVRCRVNFPLPITINSKKEEEKIYDSSKLIEYELTERAIYLGGFDILESFFRSNFKIPENLEQTGAIKFKLLIEKDGSVAISEIDNKIGYGTSQEAIRVVKLLPKWKPAKIGDDTVRSYCGITLNIDERQRLTIANKASLNAAYSIEVRNTDEPDKQPQFKGGMGRFYEYIGNNFKVPDSKIPGGKIIVTFVVGTDGKLTEIRVINDPFVTTLGYDTTYEVTKLLSNCQDWVPGESNGIPVRVFYALPITVQ
jgi:hypothetical protein